MNSLREKKNDYRSILDERINMAYTLRKKKSQEKNFQSRIQEICQMNKIDEMLEINLRELNISNDIMQAYCTSTHENKLSLACSYLRSQQDDNLIKFSMFSMRKLSEEYNGQNGEIFSIEIIDSIFTCMMNQQAQSPTNLKLFYEATQTLKNITVCSPYFTKVLSEDNYLKAMIHIFLQQTDIRIRANIILILGNILVELGFPFLKRIEDHLQFCQLISDYILRENELDYSLGTKSILFWIMSCIIDYYPKEHIDSFIDKHLKTFKIIFSYLNSNLNKPIFNSALRTLNNLLNKAGENEALILLLDQIHIYPILIKYFEYSMPQQCLIDLMNVFLSMIYYNQDVVHELFVDDFFTNAAVFLNEYSIKRCPSKKPVVMGLFDVLLNCTSNACGYGNDYVVRKSSVTFSLCEVLKCVNEKDIVIGVLKVLLSSLDNCKSDIKCEMIRIEVPELLTAKLSETNDIEIIKLCLRGITEFISFGVSLVKQKNILKELFEALNLEELLERLIIHQDPEISSCSNKLVQDYFSQ